MGIFADSLFTALMSWVRALVSGIWALFTSDHTTLLGFLGQHWLMIVIVIVAAGIVIDWLVWMVRWQPYRIWEIRLMEAFGFGMDWEDEEDEERTRLGKATAATMPRRRTIAQTASAAAQAAPQENWLPLDPPYVDEQAAQEAMRRADSVPDEALGAYPGMRYGAHAASPADDDTRTFSAVHSEGPGAAEVNRRRAEIDAWNAQMQEEARAKAEERRREAEQARLAQEAYEAEQARLAQEAHEAEQARLAQEAYEAEQARLAQEAHEAEQARLAQEAHEAEQARLAQEAYEAEQARLAQEAYEAEQARLAQAEYERQLAEYERQQAQYERDMEEYRRQKAAYDEAMARQSEQTAAAAYSDYVEGEAVESLPDAPDWPQMTPPTRGAQRSAPGKKEKKEKKPGKASALLGKMAKMLETDEEEISGINALPPRVNAQDAYHPAARPQGNRRRK